MTLELTQAFYFDAAHTLQREYEADASRRCHGHTYHAEVTVRGVPDASTGMVVDLGVLRAHVERVRRMLDHRLLDDVPDLGAPTLENLCLFIGRHLADVQPPVTRVRVSRKASGDSCVLDMASR